MGCGSPEYLLEMPWRPHWVLYGVKTRDISAPTGQPFKGRVKNVVVMTFAARRRYDGSLAPAYARYLGNAGNNFLSNTWRAGQRIGRQAMPAYGLGWGLPGKWAATHLPSSGLTPQIHLSPEAVILARPRHLTIR